MICDHPPEPIGTGRVRGAFVEHHRGPVQQAAEDQPGPHHPADVGVPEDDIALPHVEAVGHVLRRLQGKAGVHVDRTLGFARRTAGVDQQQRRLGLEVLVLGA